MARRRGPTAARSSGGRRSSHSASSAARRCHLRVEGVRWRSAHADYAATYSATLSTKYLLQHMEANRIEASGRIEKIKIISSSPKRVLILSASSIAHAQIETSLGPTKVAQEWCIILSVPGVHISRLVFSEGEQFTCAVPHAKLERVVQTLSSAVSYIRPLFFRLAG